MGNQKSTTQKNSKLKQTEYAKTMKSQKQIK